MKAEKIKQTIEIGASLFGFEYKNKECNIDPCYNRKKQCQEYLLYCDGNEMTVYSIDEVMNTPFFDGHSLNEISEEIIITEY